MEDNPPDAASYPNAHPASFRHIQLFPTRVENVEFAIRGLSMKLLISANCNHGISERIHGGQMAENPFLVL